MLIKIVKVPAKMAIPFFPSASASAVLTLPMCTPVDDDDEKAVEVVAADTPTVPAISF